jgi:hypothetical protein
MALFFRSASGFSVLISAGVIVMLKKTKVGKVKKPDNPKYFLD